MNIDYSEEVINKMKLLHQNERPLMSWVYMDMTDLTFPSESFDVVIDKASMDALMVDEGDVWCPNHSVIESADKMCLSISRVLKSSQGKFIQISFAQPHFRTKYLIGSRVTQTTTNHYSVDVGICIRYNWNLLKHISIEKEVGCLNSFMFIMTKL